MKFLSIDLEQNQPSGKIIQIGACVGDTMTGEVIETLSAFVKIDEPIHRGPSVDIQKLTGISDELLAEQGTSLIDAYRKLLALENKYPDRMPAVVQWGGGDTWELKKQLTTAYDQIIIGKTFEWPFGGAYFDVKKLYQAHRIAHGKSYASGLGKSMGRMGLQFKGQAHDALTDAINTFHLFNYLLKQFNPQKGPK
jgi:inhibitor of KinA sporulation pathway (predicted exonuclease)